MTLGDEHLLRDVVSSVVRPAGFDLEDLTVITAGRRRVVRVVIDSDDGVDLDAAARISRSVSQVLDERGDEVLAGAPYTLEVTSPGVGRPLTAPRHFRRAAGRLVTIALADGTSMQARILRAGDDSVDVLTGADGLQRRTVRLADVARAKVEVEFSPPPAAVAALLAGEQASAAGPGEEDPNDQDRQGSTRQEGMDAR